MISLRRNVRPGFTILQTNDNFPINDRSSFFVHFLRLSQNCNALVNSLYLSFGMLMVISVESMPMPRYVIAVVGPHNLSSAIGILKYLNMASKCLSWDSAA